MAPRLPSDRALPVADRPDRPLSVRSPLRQLRQAFRGERLPPRRSNTSANSTLAFRTPIYHRNNPRLTFCASLRPARALPPAGRCVHLPAELADVVEGPVRVGSEQQPSRRRDAVGLPPDLQERAQEAPLPDALARSVRLSYRSRLSRRWRRRVSRDRPPAAPLTCWPPVISLARALHAGAYRPHHALFTAAACGVRGYLPHVAAFPASVFTV